MADMDRLGKKHKSLTIPSASKRLRRKVLSTATQTSLRNLMHSSHRLVHSPPHPATSPRTILPMPNNGRHITVITNNNMVLKLLKVKTRQHHNNALTAGTTDPKMPRVLLSPKAQHSKPLLVMLPQEKVKTVATPRQTQLHKVNTKHPKVLSPSNLVTLNSPKSAAIIHMAIHTIPAPTMLRI